jgi:GABA permease
MAGAEDSPELQKSLESRHMTMSSLGGVIGAGLFVGSSAVINTTGPAAERRTATVPARGAA